ncbi:hypothetical protein [Streptomyces sp. NPDC048057]|uniref:hypothetical protein n=1 Tax=Streptomyces sp. NPDC048057 TaxID=3155628 RepID=UPI0033BFD894
MKYLRVTVRGPHSNTEQTSVIEVDDDFEKDGAEDNEIIENAVWDYVSYSSELVDEADLDESERADLGLDEDE